MSLKTRPFKLSLAGILLASTSLCLPSRAAAQIASADGNTKVYSAPNGVQVVDIAKANQSGLSHNKFSQYNVPANGVVLNNGTRDQLTYQSQLAGRITANLNLDKSAKVILNEVVGADRSTLAGYTEVAGSAASVIVANPYGITCNGCGFINTPNVQIITGRPNVDASGNLQGFTVTGGDILVTGSGINASAQDYLALVARKVRIEGQVNARQLDTVAGVNDWDSDTLVVTARKPTDAAPDYAIDSSALGGMYANRIRLIATEAGVGVRMLGEAAASGSDFTIDAAGKVELANRISAKNDLHIATSASQDMALDQAQLTAARDLSVSAAGALTLSGGSLVAGRNLTLTAASLGDTAQASSAADANRRYAASSLALTVTGAAAIDGTSYGAGAGLTVHAGSLAIGSHGATLYSDTDAQLATQGALSLGIASVKTANALTLNAGGQFSTSADTQQAVVSTASDITLVAGSIDNAGRLSAEAGKLSLSSAGLVANSGWIQAKGAIDAAIGTAFDNSGTLLAGGAITLGLFGDHAPYAFTNAAKGEIQAGSALTLQGVGAAENMGALIGQTTLAIDSAALTNGGTIQAAQGATVSTGALVNSGTLIGSQAAGSDLKLTADTLNNSGTIQSAGNLAATLGSRLDNSGKLLAAGKLDIGASTSAAFAIDNGTNAYLQAGGDLTLSGAGAIGNQGVILSAGALDVAAASLVNAGTLQANGSRIAAASLTNNGTLIGAQGAQDTTLIADTLVNTGTLQSGGALSASLADQLDNSGKLLASGDLTIRASDASGTLQIANGGNAYLQSGGLLTLSGTNGGRNLAVTSLGGYVLADRAELTTGAFTSNAFIQTTEGLAIDAGAFVNAGTILAKTTFALSAASVENQASGRMQGSDGASIDSAGAVANAGTLILGYNNAKGGSVSGASIANSGTLQSAGDLTLSSGGSIANGGLLIADGNLAMGGSNTDATVAFTNAAGGIAQAGRQLSLAGAAGGRNASFANAGNLRAGSMAIHARSASNAGKIQSLGDAAFDIGGAFTNSNAFLAQGLLTLSAESVANSAAGKMQALGTSLTAASLDNDGSFLLASDAGRTATLTLDSLNNSGALEAAGDLTLQLRTNLTNAGSVLAGGKLLLDNTGAALQIANKAAGGIRAGGELDITDSGISFSEQSGVLRGDTLKLSLASLTNNGTIQSDRNGSVTITGGLTNNAGKLIYLGATSGTGSTLTVGSLSNRGTVQTSGDLTLHSGGAITNDSDAKLLSNGKLIIAGTSGAATLTNGGLVQALDALDISGTGSGSRLASVHGLANSVMSGGIVSINADKLALDDRDGGAGDGAGLASSGNMTLNLGLLKMGGTYSYVTAVSGGSGVATITIDSDLTNEGLIYSAHDLAITAGSLTNNVDAGLAASGKMTLSATGGDIRNYGSFYVGSSMVLNAAGGTIQNYRGAAIDSDGSITATAANFTNNSNINAKGDITISATEFHNEVEGGDTRVWSYAGSSFDGVGDLAGDQDNRAGANEEDHSGVLGWSAENYDTGHEHNDTTWWWHATFYTTYDFAGGSRPDYNPKMIANGTMTIKDFQDGKNLGGILSATTLNISTSKAGALFVNDNLTSTQQNWYAEWNHYEDCNAVTGDDCDYTRYRSYDKRITSTTTISSVGGGIYAGTLNASGFGLTNAGSPYSAATTSDSKTAPSTDALAGGAANVGSAAVVSAVASASKAGAAGAVSGVSGAGVVGATTGADGRTTINFVGISVTVPSSPNGLYVVSPDPKSNYLIETNPRFTGAGGSGVGSDYIAERLGINPDDLTRRLGDANYEAYLIQQQIAGQTGAAVLRRGETNDQQVQRLMNAAVDQAGELDLTYGKALTDEQAANLKQDIVWLVETEVSGQKVLAPVVYLSAATKAMFDKGSATIAADNANLNLTSVTNTGGTIEGSKTLSITSQGDITNTSGTIKGGDVALTSTQGSIVNQTLVATTGSEGNMSTDFGKSAGIEATGSLTLDANKNITVSGATVTAGGDASLKAGEDITFTSIQDKNSTSQAIKGGTQTTTTITERGSGLTVGGNLAVDSGGDTTFKASSANVAGNADIKTGGDFNILAGQNSTETHAETSKSGVGVGGGVWGSETTTTDEFHGRNAASSFTVGGNMSVDSKGDMTVQGSNVNVAGNADVKADSVNILQGNDVDRKTSTTETQTYLRTSSGTDSGTSTYAGASASAGGLSAQASAGAGAEAHNSNQGNLELYNNTTTTTTSDKSTAVGSTFNVGGNANIQAKNDVTLQGSELNAGGNVNVDAKNINLLAAENRDVTTTTTNSTSVGLMVDNNNSAGADAGASASASLTAQAQAEAKAQAESDTTIDLARNTQSTTTTTDITHTGSSIKSGGNTSLTATDQLNVQGSSVEAAGDVNLTAKDMRFGAVNDVHEVSTTSQSTHAGLYVNGNAEAKAGAEANMTGASAGASAGAEASYGINVSHDSSSAVDGSTTAQTSSIKAGGNMTRTATNSITDVGTDIEAGGNFTQTAKTWDSKAAADTTYGNASSQKDSARIGTYADAEAGASAGTGLGGGTGADADASVGVKASYDHEDAKGAYSSSTAKVSNIKVGGNFSSTTSDKTSLEGTNVDVAGNADLTAGSLDYKAAHDTQSSSSSSNTGSAEVKVGISVTKAVKAEASGGYGHEDEQSSSSHAVAGGFSAGGNLNIKTTKGDANFEGTNVAAGGNGSIQSAGSVNFTAARDEASSSSNSRSVDVGISTSAKGGSKSGGIEAGGGFSHSDAQSSTANAGSFTTGGSMTVSAGKDANFEGTKLNSGGQANVSAGGDVNFKAAESTSSSHAYGAELNVSAEAEKKGSKDKPAAGGSDAKGNGESWQPASPSKSSGGSEGNSKPGGAKDGPTIGSQRAKPNEGGGTSGSTDSKPAGKSDGPTIGSQRATSNGNAPSKPIDSNAGGKQSEKPTGKSDGPTIGGQRTTSNGNAPSKPTDRNPGDKQSDKPVGPGKGPLGTGNPAKDQPKPGNSPSKSTDSKPGDKQSDKPAGPDKNPLATGNPAKGEPQSGSSPSKPADSKPGDKQSDKPVGPDKNPLATGNPAKGKPKPGWQSAKPGAGKKPGGKIQIGGARAEAPGEEKKKPGNEPEKKGGAEASFQYESATSKTYQGSTITSGGGLSISAGGNVSRENVTTNVQGTQTTNAGGTISDKVIKDQKDVTAVKGALQGKSISADTGTGSADNAGDTGP